jgi:hypothetical protein
MEKKKKKVLIKHWLYGGVTPSGMIELNKLVKVETDCRSCIHDKVCHHDNEKLCVNYEFATSAEHGCYGCIHKYTRWDTKQPIKCFKCTEYCGVTKKII